MSCLQRCLGSFGIGWFCLGRGPWTNGGGLLCLIPKAEPQAARPAHPHHRSPRLGPRAFSISVVNSFRGNFVRMPPLFTHQFQAEPCRGSRREASIIERINLGCASNLMPVLVSLSHVHFCGDMISPKHSIVKAPLGTIAAITRH